MNNIALYSVVGFGLGLAFSSTVQARDIVNLKTLELGVHEVSYQVLSEYGADVAGEAVADLALINQGKAVQIQVTGSDADASIFGEGSVIRFIAKPMDTLYTDTNVYTLRSESSSAQRMTLDNRSIPVGASATSYLATRRFSPQSQYSFTSPDQADPWYAKRIVAVSGPQSERMSMTLDDVAPGGNSGGSKAKLSVSLWGSADLVGVADDHSVAVSFNGRQVVAKTFDGLNEAMVSTEIDVVNDGSNSITVTLPMDTGYAFDAVNLNSIEVKYPRKFVAEDNRLDFESSARRFRVSGFNPDSMENGEADVLAVREDSQGLSIMTNTRTLCRGTCLVTMPGSGVAAHYYITTKSAVHRPVIDALPVEQDITSGQANYLIISHPDFIGSDGNNMLEDLAAELSSELGSAKVVDVEAIYAQFGHHLFDPAAIQDYIRYAVTNLGTQYVVLVGGDIYDYRNFENDDATSFIPSIYAAAGNNITFAPVDAKYVDLNDDNVPDLPIGRLPVRTTAQLETLLNKRDAYLNRDYAGKALLVADKYDEVQQYNFADDADEIDQQYLQNFEVEKAYVDILGLRDARNSLSNAINQGVSLTAFFGHSSTNQWSFDGLLTGPDAARLDNAGKPTVVTQWGCWNAYYVSPNEDSMGHRFMMEGEQGAVAVMGASTLTNANSERRLAKLVFARLANGERLGNAVTNAKQEYAQDHPNDLDVLLGWTILGLPDLLVN